MVDKYKHLNYCQAQDACGIKAGDIVRVTRRAFHEELGWSDSWISDMNDYVGKEFKALNITGSGVQLKDYIFPYFVLTKVEAKKPSKPEVKLKRMLRPEKRR